MIYSRLAAAFLAVGSAFTAPVQKLAKRNIAGGPTGKLLSSSLLCSPSSHSPSLPPHSRQIDIQILNYALTLEHLENKFYYEGLAKFDAAAFVAAGFAPFVRERLEQISSHEAEHVSFLSGALGSAATQACNYTL